MILVYILSALWSLACLAGLVMVIRMVGEYGYRSNWLGLIVAIGLGAPVAFFLGVLPWAFIGYEQSPELVTLKKHEWVCSAAHYETTYVMSGKVMVPVTNEICDQYGRL